MSDEASQQKLTNIMHQMFAKAKKYQNLLDSAHSKLKKFGWRRIVLFWRFRNVNIIINRYENSRMTYVALALAISRKIHAKRRLERKRRLDH